VIKFSSSIVLSLFFAIAIPGRSALAQTWLLDDFESSSIRIVQPNTNVVEYKYLWNLYDSNGTGTSITTADKHDGNRSLLSASTGGTGWQFQFYTYTESLPGWSDGWKYMRMFVNNPSLNAGGGTPAWQMGKVNRMRFWIKVSPNVTAESGGDHNFEFGTYLRKLSAGQNSAESDNHHHYHKFNFAYTGEWEQVIVDTHPDHIRGANGDTEHPDLLYPYNDGNTYFDLMTRFYLDFPYMSSVSTSMDGFELYQETNAENVDQVRSIHAVYVPTTNQVRVGWMRRKDQSSVKHEVRYAFSDIFSSGWSNATPAPDGIITPPSSGGYNGMSWSTYSLNLSGQSLLYVAIKPQNSSLFRQIVIPLSPGAVTALSPPTNLRVIP
jgi:hypothetical protein